MLVLGAGTVALSDIQGPQVKLISRTAFYCEAGGIVCWVQKLLTAEESQRSQRKPRAVTFLAASDIARLPSAQDFLCALDCRSLRSLRLKVSKTDFKANPQIEATQKLRYE